jgi:hypothetical protein
MLKNNNFSTIGHPITKVLVWTQGNAPETLLQQSHISHPGRLEPQGISLLTARGVFTPINFSSLLGPCVVVAAI